MSFSDLLEERALLKKPLEKYSLYTTAGLFNESGSHKPLRAPHHIKMSFGVNFYYKNITKKLHTIAFTKVISNKNDFKKHNVNLKTKVLNYFLI